MHRADGRDRGAWWRGRGLVESSLLMAWLLFLLAGAFQAGIYAQAAIATQNAAGAAAVYTSASPENGGDSDGACAYALGELNTLPNARKLTSCTTLPVRVTAGVVSAADGQPASLVTVEYRTPALLPIPGMNGQVTFTRTVQARL